MYPQREEIGVRAFKGTTTVGIVCTDGVVLGTDTRATSGFFVASKQAKKLHKIDEHVAMTIAGTVADAQALLDVLKVNATLYRLRTGYPISIGAIARLTANILFSNRLFPLELQAIIAGVDSSGPHLFALDPLGSLTEERYMATGSGSPIAFGVLEDGYRDGLRVEEAIPIAIRALYSALKRDVGTGDGIDVATITEKEGYRELTLEEKRRRLEELGVRIL